MHAELSRRAAKMMQSPYWSWLKSGLNFETSLELDRGLTSRLVTAYTFDNLESEDKKLFAMCEKSDEIARNLYNKGANFLTEEELEQVASSTRLDFPQS